MDEVGIPHFKPFLGCAEHDATVYQYVLRNFVWNNYFHCFLINNIITCSLLRFEIP